MTHNPVQIKIQNQQLHITWDDNSQWHFPLQLLRDECPCAGCKGETILLRTFKPAEQPPKTAESYKIAGIQTVGGYAIQIDWKDGHNTGLYSWDYLLNLLKSTEEI
ncbi:MAG: DUF971 domain-containing protein [Ignavibacteriales bacterium]|nr:DUF971 domain-containing protein [Ignavibacteriales bacterium]